MNVVDRLRARAADRLRAIADRLRPGRDDLATVTRSIGDDWRRSPYYDEAEQALDDKWRALLWPMIQDCDFTSVVDLAAGHGRNSARLLEHASRLYVADINAENIAFCRRRFGADSRVHYIVNDGLSLPTIASDTVSLVYTFDAMVHFDSDTVRAYLRECRRILRVGGRALCHHSNFTGSPAGDFHQSPHWRNFMSAELFEHYAHKEGLRVVRRQVIDWGVPSLDCLTLLERPA